MRRAVVVLAVIVALGGGLGLASRGFGQPPKGKLTVFMRPKLEHSKAVLEGLSLENFELIDKNARALKDLSESAEWKVSPNITYLRYSIEVQRLADELIEQASRKNVDGATLAYLQLTMTCVNCHKYVRQNNIISSSLRGRPDPTRVR
jgi:hypothetical protein